MKGSSHVVFLSDKRQASGCVRLLLFAHAKVWSEKILDLMFVKGPSDVSELL